jgi:hypothetical protein
MDKTGIIAIIIGIALCALGAWAIWAFLPEVVIAVKGLVGIAVVCFGLMLVVFGILIVRD